MAAGFFASAVVVAQAWCLSDIVNRIFLGGGTLGDALPLLAVLLLLSLIRSGLVWAGDVWGQRAASRVKDGLRGQITGHLRRLGPVYARGEHTGELTNATVQGVETLDEYIAQYQPARWLAGLVPVMILLVVLALDPLSTLVMLFAGPMLVLLLVLIGRRAKDLTDRRFSELSWMSAFFLDMLQGLPTLKMFGRSREQADNIEAISRRYGSTTLEVLRTAFQISLVLEWGATAATALVAFEIGMRLMARAMPFDRALAVLILTPEFFLPLRRLALRYHAGTAGKTAAQRLFAILDTAPSAHAVSRNSGGGQAELPKRFDIRFQDVNFAYANGERPALQGFSLAIPHGTTLALVGPTGGGKTTAANLLLRFIEPDAGEITVGGRPLQALDPAAWRSQVAWVPQLPHLFYGAVADNIRLARPTASLEEVVAAATAAHAHEFIQRLPEGYNTPIGEHGARLSGGQHQRIAIARAFLRDAPLVILDEATSHLDAESEAAIAAALRRLTWGRTVLIIAHRLRMVYTADQIAVVEAGRVIEIGGHRDLLVLNRRYRQLVLRYEEGRA